MRTSFGRRFQPLTQYVNTAQQPISSLTTLHASPKPSHHSREEPYRLALHDSQIHWSPAFLTSETLPCEATGLCQNPSPAALLVSKARVPKLERIQPMIVGDNMQVRILRGSLLPCARCRSCRLCCVGSCVR